MRDEARLDVFKALGDNTRYAIYLELARSPQPLATAEVASSLGLHVNTVRPHLERMREAGLLDVEVDARGGVGRPQHRYTLAADAPSLGLEPSVFPLASRLLLQLATGAGAESNEATEIGFQQGLRDGVRVGPGPCVAALVEHLSNLGFDPAVEQEETATTVAFTRCPFHELAAANPSLVCALHRGIVEGFVAAAATHTVSEFRTLADRDPCQVRLVATASRPGVE